MEMKLNTIFLMLIVTTTISLGCKMKQFTNSESFVCVCDQIYCDSVNRLPHSLDGHLTMYLTDKKFHRLAKSLIPVSDLDYNLDERVDVQIKVNTSNRRQSITGFGGAFTDAAGINIKTLSSDMADRLMNDYYGETGLHYTISRVPIAGSDFSDRPYSYDDTEGDYDLKNFSLARDDFDYKIPLIKKALNLSSELKLFASPWSPPSWLKTNKKFNGLGILEGEPGTAGWKTWAAYIVKFLQAYRYNGIEFWGLTPENEPNVGLYPESKWNALGFTGEMMKEWIKKDLGPALTQAGFTKDKLKIMIYDDSLSAILPFIRAVLLDKEAAKYVSGIAFHWYSRSYYETLDKIHDLYPEYFLLSTEACEGSPSSSSGEQVSLGSWTRAENIAKDIIEGLNRWSTGWTDWNLVLNEQGGPNWVNNFVDAMIIVNTTSNEYYKQPMYYAFGHFTKFLRPGSVHVNHEMVIKSPVDSNKIKMTTFVSPSNELILTILNRHESAIKLSIEGVVDKGFILIIEPRSLTTLIKPINN